MVMFFFFFFEVELLLLSVSLFPLADAAGWPPLLLSPRLSVISLSV